MELRRSRVLDRLRAGEVVSCFKVNLACARSAEIAALAGFDCVWTDMEHTANNWSVIEQMVWATKAHDVDLLTRVSRGSYSDYVRPLELDSTGIMVPHIMSAADARAVARMTRFHPVGRRATDGGNADGGYCGVEFTDYLAQANDRRFVIVQIEDPEPLPELDEIAAVDGIDMLFFGPGDFSHSIGAPGQWDHPEIMRARRAVADACARHGKFAGTVGGPATLAQWVDMGYQFVSLGADVIGVAEHCRTMIDAYAARSAR